ncbi:MAG: phospho-N-acetylmuramoyl-pentapeptide-transferase, partial [Acidobacteria bacterium]
MLYHLLYPLHTQVSGFNVIRYQTFRTAVASLTALFLVLILGPWMIERLRRLQVGQYIREEGPQAHQTKKGTPTMGGLLILAGIIIPTLLWANLTNRNVWIAVLSTLAFGAIGFADDYLKVVKKRNLGLTGRSKLYFQLAIGFLIGTTIYAFARVDPTTYSTRIIVPFFKTLLPDLGLLYIPFAVLFVAFASNAVNLTDGL